MIVKGIRFHQVDDVEPVGFACSCVAHFEVVPLSVPTSIVVRL